jgi:transcriptional regulator with XRE-family HTH domain
MSDRQKIISRLIADRDFRADYIRAKLDVLIPSQLRALRMRENKTQPELAQMADMKQSRISAMETPGLVNFNRETLVRMAATHSVGIVIKFVPFSEMLEWENSYSQDAFSVPQLADDTNFLYPATIGVRKRPKRKRTARRILSSDEIFQTPMATGGVGASTYMIPVQRERVQLRLQFKPSESASAQDRIANVIPLPNRRGSVVNDLSNLRAAAGAGGHYGN